MDNIIKTFTDLGLLENEAEILKTCLSHPDGLYVHEMAKLTKVKRTTIDLVVDRLVESGYLTRKKNGARYLYNAVKPEILVMEQKEKFNNLQKLLPLLVQMGSRANDYEITFYEGKEGIYNLYRDLFNTMKSEILSGTYHPHLNISSGLHVQDLLGDVNSFLEKTRLEIGFKIQIIAPLNSKDVPAWQSSAEKKRVVRYFDDKKYPFEISIDIFGDKVAIQSTKNFIHGLVLSNKEVAQSMRSVFSLVWNYLQ